MNNMWLPNKYPRKPTTITISLTFIMGNTFKWMRLNNLAMPRLYLGNSIIAC